MRSQKFYVVFRDGRAAAIVRGLSAVYQTKRDYYTAYRGYTSRDDAVISAFWHNRLLDWQRADQAAAAEARMATRRAAPSAAVLSA